MKYVYIANLHTVLPTCILKLARIQNVSQEHSKVNPA